MFRAFELTIDEDILDEDFFNRCAKVGRNKAVSDRTEIKELLREVISCGTIDGTALTEQYFPTFHRDVFLSYSHNDSELAYMMAGMLSACFGLTVFIDSLFWGSADELLKEIDNEYCYQEDGKTYSYEKRNFSTSHVHTMLTSAILKAMDQSEIIIFLNTLNSVPDIAQTIGDGGYDYTLSPWIYEEILFTTMLKETDWETYRREWRIDESVDIFAKSLNIAYKLPKEKLIPLTIDDLEDWVAEYNKRKADWEFELDVVGVQHYERHPLNILYELKCGKKQIW